MRRLGLMPASSVQRNHWFHIERGNSARGPGNKPDQFKPVHDDALSNWSPPRRFHFNCHCV
jgi:hypothetical protein